MMRRKEMWQVVLDLRADRDREAARVEQLLQLLMARAAPADFYAQTVPVSEDPAPQWLFSDDGLAAVPWEPEDED